MTGAYNTAVELLAHFALILYHVNPKRHHSLKLLFLQTSFGISLLTLIGTIIAAIYFADLWNQWRLTFKIAAPIIHILFSASQIYGSVIFWRMYKREQQQIHEGEINRLPTASQEKNDIGEV
jgi:O-antigen/teichoic acid export membrane protein